MKNIYYLTITIFMGSLGCHSQSVEEKYQKEFEAVFEENKDAIGAIIHLEYPDKNISWTSALGFSDKEGNDKLENDQPLLIASNTKTYVAASVLRLIEMDQIKLDQTLNQSLSKETRNLLNKAGYNLETITIKHLLSHTSGIQDYVDESYFEFIKKNPKHKWKKEKQIELSINKGSPLFEAGEKFSYGDINYLLLTEIIELQTNEPFYIAISDLLKFKELNLNHTWFKDMEPIPKGTKPMAHQYADIYNWDSYELDPSWDIYGGGGIATTAKEAALFYQYLFEGRIIQDEEILESMWTYVLPEEESKYCLGMFHFNFGTSLFYHGGWWGTDVAYSPEANASVAMFTLKKDKRSVFATYSRELLESLVEPSINSVQVITKDNFELHKAKKSEALLVLFPGGGSTSKETKEEFDVANAATENNISVLFMNFNRHLWIEEDNAIMLTEQLESVVKQYDLSTDNIVIGGISIGGNVALSLSNHLQETKSFLTPKSVFIVDSPIDLYGLYESSIKDTKNPNLTEERLSEPKWIISYFEEEFGIQDSLLKNIQKVSPFTNESQFINIPNLKNIKLRFYTEPDSSWYMENRQTDFESTNAYTIQQISILLKQNNWNYFELIQTQNKGFRADGSRHPHSWSIVDINNLIDWINKDKRNTTIDKK